MKNKKILLPLLGLAVLALVLVVLEKTRVTNFIKLHPTPNTAVQGPTPEQKQQEAEVNAAKKQELVDNEASKTTTTDTGTTTSSAQTIDLSAKQESNNTVTVFTKLYNYSGGLCNLTVTNSGASNNQTAVVMYQPEYATCAGFSVPISALGAGTWNINLKVDSNGASTTKSISFKVV